MSEDLSLVLSSNTTQTISAQLARASAKVAGFLEAGLQGAANTERAYTSDLKSYVAFCERHGLQAVPADVDTLTEYVAYLATKKPTPEPGAGGSGRKESRKASSRSLGRTRWPPFSATWPPSAKPINSPATGCPPPWTP